ncbi:hypothetical protein D1007_19036 [Hordeum vulgare]|nr:hypothetical protein D1007_19036 [Hordeum vulgare]
MADKAMGVDDLIGKLNLQEREEDDLNFDEEFPEESAGAEFMVIAKVHTEKPFSKGAFYESMRMEQTSSRSRKEQVIRSLTRKVGEVSSVMLNPRWGDRRIVRVRVRLNVNEPLMRFFSITRNQRKVYYSILYEKMPVFCYVCGHMGHTFLEHGNGKHDRDAMAWETGSFAARSVGQPQGTRQQATGGNKVNP